MAVSHSRPVSPCLSRLRDIIQSKGAANLLKPNSAVVLLERDVEPDFVGHFFKRLKTVSQT